MGLSHSQIPCIQMTQNLCSIFQRNLILIRKHMKRNNHRILLYLTHPVIVSFGIFFYEKQVSLKNRTQQQFVTSYRIFIFWPLPLLLATQNTVFWPKVSYTKSTVLKKGTIWYSQKNVDPYVLWGNDDFRKICNFSWTPTAGLLSLVFEFFQYEGMELEFFNHYHMKA